MHKSKLIFAVAAILALFSLSAQAKLYKWVDENGVTHYGSTIPPRYAGQKSEELQNGMVVPNTPKPATSTGKVKQPPKQLTPAQIEQKRRDNALLGTYDSPDEIDRAMNRELRQVDAQMSSINIQLQTAQEDLKGLSQQKSELEKAHRPVGKLLQERLDQVNRRLAQLNASKAQTEAKKQKIRASYSADKKRFIELTTAKPSDQDQSQGQ